MTAKQKQDMAAEIKRAIRASGLSGHGLARLAGVPQPVISLFLAGKRSIIIDTASRLAGALGLELRAAPKRQARKRTGRKGA
jgi:plasmid maintenance system antidote protein VapI